MHDKTTTTSALDIPASKSIVSVRAISPNRVRGVPPDLFLHPTINGTAYADTPCLSFLIEHAPTTATAPVQRLLFDLGIRKDWENSVPAVAEAINQMNIQIDTPRDVSDQLLAEDIPQASISTIILSHYHFDHLGDPSLFPATTSLIVGPGFTASFTPGYPTNPTSPIPESALLNRDLIELDFSTSRLTIGGLQAIDYFNDGSFYLLSTPGHATGHISALARVSSDDSTTSSSFILLAGDLCHHPGELRPSHAVPFPATNSELVPGICTSLARAVHPDSDHSNDTPFYTPAEGPFNADPPEMKKTIHFAATFDADPDVFVVLAHDNSLLETITLFPESLDGWKSKGWKETCRWKFLQDFEV